MGRDRRFLGIGAEKGQPLSREGCIHSMVINYLPKWIHQGFFFNLLIKKKNFALTVLFNEKPRTQFCLVHSHLGLSGEDSANGISGPEYDIIRRFLLFPTPSELKPWQYIVSFISRTVTKKDVTLS